MSDMKCPFCNETELEKGIELQGGGFILGCPKCKKFAHDVFWQELITTKKTLDASEHCCTEWEKQALDYKAENIKLSTALEVAVDALKVIGSGQIIEHSVLFHEDDNKITIANKALKQINKIDDSEIL